MLHRANYIAHPKCHSSVLHYQMCQESRTTLSFGSNPTSKQSSMHLALSSKSSTTLCCVVIICLMTGWSTGCPVLNRKCVWTRCEGWRNCSTSNMRHRHSPGSHQQVLGTKKTASIWPSLLGPRLNHSK